MACRKIRIPNRKICPGDMNARITIQSRAITAPSASGSDLIETFATTNTVWAAIKTVQGVEIFDGSNVVAIATHYFYIRYISGLTAESWIQYNSKYYDIIDIQNLEERDEFMLLRCSERGTTSNLSNQA